jgi:hypothetical protein
LKHKLETQKEIALKHKLKTQREITLENIYTGDKQQQ